MVEAVEGLFWFAGWAGRRRRWCRSSFVLQGESAEALALASIFLCFTDRVKERRRWAMILPFLNLYYHSPSNGRDSIHYRNPPRQQRPR